MTKQLHSLIALAMVLTAAGVTARADGSCPQGDKTRDAKIASCATESFNCLQRCSKVACGANSKDPDCHSNALSCGALCSTEANSCRKDALELASSACEQPGVPVQAGNPAVAQVPAEGCETTPNGDVICAPKPQNKSGDAKPKARQSGRASYAN